MRDGMREWHAIPQPYPAHPREFRRLSGKEPNPVNAPRPMLADTRTYSP